MDNAVQGNICETNNYGFASLEDEELQTNIHDSFLEALEDVGEVGYQKVVQKWYDDMEHHVQCQQKRAAEKYEANQC